jgi:UDPglucose 6-dehydrogenase
MNVAVIGLGRVGSVAAACLAEAGHSVLGIDIAPDRVKSLQKGKSGFYEPGLDNLLQETLSSGALSIKQLGKIERLDSEITMVAVGTPSLASGGSDLSMVKSALNWIANKAGGQNLVVMKCTLPPGMGQVLAQQYRLSYVANPEFLREGQAVDDWRKPDRVIIGGDRSQDIELTRRLYNNIEAPFVITDIVTAEMIKYAANAFLATKVSFINEIANVCNLVGADIEDVVAGIAFDPRIGSSFLRAGLGYGGSCFPKDIRALEFVSTLNGYSCDLLRAVISVNNRQRLLPVQVLQRELGSLNGRKVAILGLAFKPGTDDIREAPAVDIIRLLAEGGARVRVYDPQALPGGSQALPTGTTVAKSTNEAIFGAEALVLCTEWEEFSQLDWRKVRHTMRPPYLVIDGRNSLPEEVLTDLGFRYIGIGRGHPKHSIAPDYFNFSPEGQDTERAYKWSSH